MRTNKVFKYRSSRPREEREEFTENALTREKDNRNKRLGKSKRKWKTVSNKKKKVKYGDLTNYVTKEQRKSDRFQARKKLSLLRKNKRLDKAAKKKRNYGERRLRQKVTENCTRSMTKDVFYRSECIWCWTDGQFECYIQMSDKNGKKVFTGVNDKTTFTLLSTDVSGERQRMPYSNFDVDEQPPKMTITELREKHDMFSSVEEDSEEEVETIQTFERKEFLTCIQNTEIGVCTQIAEKAARRKNPEPYFMMLDAFPNYEVYDQGGLIFSNYDTQNDTFVKRQFKYSKAFRDARSIHTKIHKNTALEKEEVVVSEKPLEPKALKIELATDKEQVKEKQM